MARVYGRCRQRAAAMNFDGTDPGWPLDLSDWDGWARLWRPALRPRDIASSAMTLPRKAAAGHSRHRLCRSPAAVAADADVVITSLPGPGRGPDVVEWRAMGCSIR